MRDYQIAGDNLTSVPMNNFIKDVQHIARQLEYTPQGNQIADDNLTSVPMNIFIKGVHHIARPARIHTARQPDHLVAMIMILGTSPNEHHLYLRQP